MAVATLDDVLTEPGRESVLESIFYALNFSSWESFREANPEGGFFGKYLPIIRDYFSALDGAQGLISRVARHIAATLQDRPNLGESADIQGGLVFVRREEQEGLEYISTVVASPREQERPNAFHAQCKVYCGQTSYEVYIALVECNNHEDGSVATVGIQVRSGDRVLFNDFGRYAVRQRHQYFGMVDRAIRYVAEGIKQRGLANIDSYRVTNLIEASKLTERKND